MDRVTSWRFGAGSLSTDRRVSGLVTFFRWYRQKYRASHSHSSNASIKVLHSFYRSTQPSGENKAVLNQVDLLAQGGFDVDLIYMSSDNLESTTSAKLLTAVGLTTGTPTAQPPREWFADADILHIHNTFPAMSHEWLGSIDIPKVMTAHNYRAFCANGIFLRDGIRCMDCTTQGSSRAVLHGCYRNSRLKSIPIAIQQRSSRSLRGLMSRCHQVLLPGEPMQKTFQTLGVINSQVLHNPVTAEPRTSAVRPSRSAWLFVGRISPEKGLTDLLHLWPSSQPLIVVGDGPERQRAESVAIERSLAVQFLGNQESPEVRSLMSGSCGLIFPSKALEGAPLVYGEAMRAGLPLVAAQGSTLAAQTLADHTGTVFTWDNTRSLDSALEFVKANREDLANRTEEIYESRYTPAVWMNNVSEIYRAAASSYKSI